MNFAATAGPKQFDLADAEDPEALDLAHSLGFTLWGLQPIFADAHNGRILQVATFATANRSMRAMSGILRSCRGGPRKSNGFQQSDGSHTGRVAGLNGIVEADAHVRLRREVVHLVGLDGVEQRHQASAVDEIAVVQEQSCTRFMWINLKVIDPRRVER
jgi:hypothetical protein